MQFLSMNKHLVFRAGGLFSATPHHAVNESQDSDSDSDLFNNASYYIQLNT